MSIFTKILVPTDFSAHASEAIRYAVDVAQRYEASLTIAHVYQPIELAFPDGYVLYTPEQLASTMSELEKLLAAEKTRAESAGVSRVTTKMLQGVPASEVVHFAKANGHDLVVMGTHGRTGIQHALLGSVAEKVVRKAPCAVLAVRLPKTA